MLLVLFLFAAFITAVNKKNVSNLTRGSICTDTHTSTHTQICSLEQRKCDVRTRRDSFSSSSKMSHDHHHLVQAIRHLLIHTVTHTLSNFNTHTPSNTHIKSSIICRCLKWLLCGLSHSKGIELLPGSWQVAGLEVGALAT